MKVTFTTTIRKGETKQVAGIVVPEPLVLSVEGGKRPAVKVTLAGYTYRSTVGKMGDDYMIPLSAETRRNAGLTGDETLEVAIELDTELRTFVLPEDLQIALAAEGLVSAFEKFAPSHQKENIRSVEEAKSPETRARRITKVLEATRLKSGNA